MAQRHTRVKPLRVYSPPDDDGVVTRSTVGYRGVCDCQWRGPIRPKWSQARGDAHAHRKSIHGGAG